MKSIVSTAISKLKSSVGVSLGRVSDVTVIHPDAKVVKIKVKHAADCKACDGYGVIAGNIPCRHCNGTGFLEPR